MNPAYILIHSVCYLLILMLGYATGKDTDNEFFPNGIYALVFLACVVAFIASLIKILIILL
jgi:ABC-type multidrug transport system permease subunit